VHAIGFDHVRLSIDSVIFQCDGPWNQCEHVQLLDEVIAKTLAQDLAVIIDIHPAGDYKRQLSSSDGALEKFTLLWRRIAGYYANQNHEMAFFEVLNEPEVAVYRWSGIQLGVVEAIRQAAPQHTIIVTCGEYSNPDDLVRMPEVADTNYIVNFHYYQPHIFTHQGASWGEAYWATLQQVPFPARRTKWQLQLQSKPVIGQAGSSHNMAWTTGMPTTSPAKSDLSRSGLNGGLCR